MEDTYIKKFIEDSNLIKITSVDEALFSQDKIQEGFFIYLIMAIEEHYNIVFQDEELHIENFDTVHLIESMIMKKT